MNKKVQKKNLFVVGLLIMLVGVAGCTTSSKEQDTSDKENEQMTETVLYQAVVKEKEEDSPNRIYVSNLIPLEKESEYSSYDEVILLTEGVLVEDQETGESIDPDALMPGTPLLVELITPTPMTMSLPPQIPGNAIKKISIQEDQED